MYRTRRLVKILFLIINFLVLLVGASSIALGIWLRMDSTSVLMFFKFVPSDQTISSASSNWSSVDVISIVLIAAGGVLIIIGFCGFYGACVEILWLLRTYAAVVLVEGILLAAAAILAIVFWNSVQQSVESLAVRALNESFNDNIDNSSSFSNAWFRIMQTLKCCGWNGTSDFTPSVSANALQNESSWMLSAQDMLNLCSFSYFWSCKNHRAVYTGRNYYPIAAVPSACCRFNNQNVLLLTGSKADAQIMDPLCPMYPSNSTAAFSTGCKAQILNFVSSSQIMFINIAFVAGAVLFLAQFLSCLLLCTIKREVASRLIVAYSYEGTSRIVSRVKF